jgi:hypothetical protein
LKQGWGTVKTKRPFGLRRRGMALRRGVIVVMSIKAMLQTMASKRPAPRVRSWVSSVASTT